MKCGELDMNHLQHPNTVPTAIDEHLLETSTSMLSAMADVERLKILLLLKDAEELCVSEIAQYNDDKPNTISMRLKKLYDAGLVGRRRQEKHVYYCLKDGHIVDIISNAIAHARHTQIINT